MLVAAATLVVTACTTQIDDATVGAGVGTITTTTPAATARPAGTSPTTSTSVAPEPEPADLPQVIIGISGTAANRAPSGTALVRYDRATGEQVELVTASDLAALAPVGPLGATETTMAGVSDGEPLITGADLSPDGERIAVTVVWTTQGRTLATLVMVDAIGGSPGQVLSPPMAVEASPVSGGTPTFSHDGSKLATVGATLSIWSLDSGQVTTTDIFTPYGAPSLAWSPDGTSLSWGNHFERTMTPTSSVGRFADPARPSTLTVGDPREGTGLWWGADGELREPAGPARAVDTDATSAWVLGRHGATTEDGGVGYQYFWWPSGGDGSDAAPLAEFPPGFYALSW